jgi:hypothetical protein
MVRSNSDKFAVFLVLVVNYLVSVAISGLTSNPKLGKGGRKGSWVFAEAIRVKNIWQDY